jgi:hypothetical protein
MEKFEGIRSLADRLDQAVGIDLRKEIMAGHEQLSPGADLKIWADWLTSVADRLRQTSAVNSATKHVCVCSLRELQQNLNAPQVEA